MVNSVKPTDVCDRCGKMAMEHTDSQRFCQFYSTFRPKRAAKPDQSAGGKGAKS